MDKKLLKGSLKLSNLIASLNYKRKFRLEHPDYFEPSGTLVFCGSQGEGKTISAVQYVIKIAHEYAVTFLYQHKSKAVVYWVFLLPRERALQSCLFDTIEVVGSLRTATGYREVERKQTPQPRGCFLDFYT